MSGTNPFRRKGPSEQSTANAGTVNNARPSSGIPPINTDLARPRKTKTVKTVRIISPHSATSADGNGMPEGLFTQSRSPKSPIPASTLSPESSDDEPAGDPFSAGSDGTAGSTEDEGTRQNTLRNSETLQANPHAPSAVPSNPFKRTLASLSTEEERGSRSHGIERQPQEVEPSNRRPLYDVNDFTKLLLTGERNSPSSSAFAPPPVSSHSQHSVGDSSSNTDASSISRQSILEATAGLLQESPRTSHEGSPIDEERQKLVGNQLPSLPKSKPSTPRHRHGKLVKANAPQTVSFEDPSLSFSSSPSGRTMPMSPGTSSNTDKTLPPVPTNPGCVQESTEGLIPMPERGTYLVSTTIHESQMSQRRNPPTPPLSRRHSQLKPKPAANPERPTPIAEEHPVRPSQSPPTTATKVPPPPPPRRAGGLNRVNSSSSVSTNASVPLTQSQSSIDDAISNPSKSRPPVPPHHSPSISSVKRQSIQPSIGSPTIAPPPPPRRRGSSQSSYTPSRLSGDYRTAATERLRSDSGASSISHLQITPMTWTPTSVESKDVMADLTALQREVDELRGKFRD